MPSFFELILYLIISRCNSIILQGERNITQMISVAVTVDTDADIVEIKLAGPYGSWFGIGFGQSNMTDAYAIVVSTTIRRWDQQLREYVELFGEYKLLKTDGGILLSYQMSQLLSTASFADGSRHITVQRSRVGVTDDHYTFPNISSAADIDIIWAFGYQSGQTYSYHGTQQEGARGSSVLSLHTLAPTSSPTARPTTAEELANAEKEAECNFFNHGYDGPLATDTCMKSVDYSTTLFDSYIYECHAETNSIIAKSFWCNGENCIGTIDNCDSKGLLDSAVYLGDSLNSTSSNNKNSNYWNCKGSDKCDKVTIKYTCCASYSGNCYGGETSDKYERTYLQNICWRQYSNKVGIMLHCDDDVLIIDQYKYANCTELLSSETYDIDIHTGVTGWGGGHCDDFSYVCSGVDKQYLVFSVLLFVFVFLCL